MTSESAMGWPGPGAGKHGLWGVLKRVPWLALILQLHCLPELRTQEGGAHPGQGEPWLKMIYKSRMCSGLRGLMVCWEQADVFLFCKLADVAF